MGSQHTIATAFSSEWPYDAVYLPLNVISRATGMQSASTYWSTATTHGGLWSVSSETRADRAIEHGICDKD